MNSHDGAGKLTSKRITRADQGLFEAIKARNCEWFEGELLSGGDPNCRIDMHTVLSRVAVMDEFELSARFAKAMFQNNADLTLVDGYGRNALHLAASRGNTPLVQLLLDAGVSPDYAWRDTPPIVAAVMGFTNPLFQRRAPHYVETIRVLVSHGASLAHALPGGAGLLHEVAARCADPSVCELILNQGLAINAADGPLSRTPLHFAAAAGRAENAGLLLARGADARAVDGEGATAAVIAARTHPEHRALHDALGAGELRCATGLTDWLDPPESVRPRRMRGRTMAH